MKEIVIFGTGEIGELAHYYFKHDSEYKIVAFVADDDFVGTNTFDGLPAVPGFKITLNPNESGKFNASHVLPSVVSPYNIQQIRIDYVLDKPGMPLHVAYAHFVRRTDLANYQTARNSGVCMHIAPGAAHSKGGDD